MRYAVLFVLWLAFPASAPAQWLTVADAPYRDAARQLQTLIDREMADKKLPSLAVALVDDQKVVWAYYAGTPPGTVYRVGSVSKLFTDVAVMQLVEDGVLDLDAPVAKYVPDFKPVYKDGQKEITLRMLMSHRSGLIREPPVGNYFDDTEPTLAKTVASLNGIELIYNPGERTKYSNAGIGLVGYAIEKTQKECFETYVQRRVLDRLDMEASSFLPTPAAKKNLAKATMWTYHGREFPAPTFELGMSPAGCMYSTVEDLAKFQKCLFAGGRVGRLRILKPETIAEMLTPQFAAKGEKVGFGLGFALGELDGKKLVGHGGAVYGFSTQFTMLPTEKLGAIVVSARDVSNAVTTRIANDALRLMLAAKAGTPLPKIAITESFPIHEALDLAGRYRSDDRYFDLTESFGNLHLHTDRGGSLLRVRKSGKDLAIDDLQAWVPSISPIGEKITLGKLTYTKEKPSATPPPESPAKFAGLIGEYGWDHNTLYVLEENEQLFVLIEWLFYYPLTEVSDNVFKFPDYGLYHGEGLTFSRDDVGIATEVVAAEVRFARREVGAKNGQTFQITPVRPIDELREIAMASSPPVETGEYRDAEFTELVTLDPSIKLDIRYATTNNFTGSVFYQQPRAFMQRPAAEAIARANLRLKELGLGLLIHDAYRPWHVTKMFWDATPNDFKDFVANPANGSRHNRGCAVDLTLFDLKSNQPVQMVAGYDEFSSRSLPTYPGGTSRQRWYREVLRKTMEAEEFTVFDNEWWHFDFIDWKKYRIANFPFENLIKAP